MRNIRDFDVTGERVLVRCDFNEPLDDSGNLLDDFRIKKSLPTIKYLVDHSARVILMSHLGDPEGRAMKGLEMKNIKNALEKLLGLEIAYANDCVGRETEDMARALKNGEILLLENLRFHKEEEDNNREFAQQLAALGDVYVNDAFSACHRAHASVSLVPEFLPAAAGLLLESELEHLEKVRHNPVRPFVAIMGGKKAETKAEFIENIAQSADAVLIGGLIKKELEKEHSHLLENSIIMSPEDSADPMDISPETAKAFREKIAGAKTIVWNGPLGKIEDKKYRPGTLAVAQGIIESGAFSVVGGGETVGFLRQEGLLEKFSWVSTGGGAMLEFLSGEKLPGLEALNYYEN